VSEAIKASSAPFTVNRTHDVPAFAGSSNDNRTVYIDRRVPKRMVIEGKEIDPAKYLAVHERTEHNLMVADKMPYLEAHHHATAAERAAVEADGVDWKSYEAHIDGMLRTIEGEKIKRPPKDLYLKPYHIDAWGNEAEKIERHMDRRNPAASVSGKVRLVPVDGDPFKRGDGNG